MGQAVCWNWFMKMSYYVTVLIWGYSNCMSTPKLMNKQCCFSISRPSFQRIKSRKSAFCSLSFFLYAEMQINFSSAEEEGGGFINHIPILIQRTIFPQNINIDLWSSFYNSKSYLSCVGNLLMKKFWSLKKIQDKTSDKVEIDEVEQLSRQSSHNNHRQQHQHQHPPN